MATTNATTTHETSSSVDPYRLVKYGLAAMLATVAANVLVLFVGLATVGFPSEFVGGPFGPLAAGPVVANSAVAVVGATLAYGVIARYSERPNRTFIAVAGVVLVLSFAMFLAPDLAGAAPRVFALLAVMHVTAAVTIVGVLTRVAASEAAAR